MTSNDLVRAASGPCLLLREEDIPPVQAKIDSQAWAKRAYKNLLDAGHTRLAKAVEIPDKGGQWPHWYSCQNCGTRLVTESPTVHRCPSCDLVNSGEPWDSVPLTDVHNGLSEDIRNLAVCFALSGERPFAEKAAEILLGYAEAYPSYPVRDFHQKTDSVWATKVSWGTLGEATWLIPVCCGYDLIRHADVLRPAEHQAIREQLLRPAAKLILKHNLGIHNIQCWHNCAIGMAALLLRDADLLSFTVDGEVGIREQIERGTLPDGLWFEGSFGYHFYTVTPLLTWATALRNCGLNLFDARLKSLFEAPLKAVLPDGSMPQFNDSGGSPIRTQAGQYEQAFSTYADERFLEPIEGSDRDSLQALLFGAPELPDTDTPGRSTEHLPDSGYIYSRQGTTRRRTYVAFDYGPHGGGHGHPDKLNFVLYARGAVQAPDPGSVAYGIPIHQQWYKQTVSHNTVVLDGKSQQPTQGDLHFLVCADGLDLIQADAGEAFEDARMTRTMLVAQDTVLVVDRLSSDHSHTYDWVYHNRGAVRTDFPRRKLKTPLGESDGYEIIGDLRRGRPEAQWRSTWKQEKSGVRLTMIGSRRQTDVYSGTGPANVDSPGMGSVAEEVPFILARREGRRRTTFAAALQAFGSRPARDTFEVLALDQPDRGRAYRYRCGSTDLTLAVSFLPGERELEEIAFRGAAAVIDRSSADRVILYSGTSIRWRGQDVVISTEGSLEVSTDHSGLRIRNLSETSLDIAVKGRSTSLPAGRVWRVPSNA